jgi:hypothetical protein
VLKAARGKLLFNTGFDPKNVDQVFAVLAVRIGLEISNGDGEASSRLAKEAVRSHMRILVGVSGRIIITAAPSEPMLAVAAASILNDTPRGYKGAVETLLNELILRGLVLDRGLQGELYSRLLLTLARDKAVLPEGGDFVKEQGLVHTVLPTRLSEFFKTLLGADLGIPLSNMPQSRLRNDFLQEMEWVWINFTHFIQLPDSISEVTPSMLCAAWSAGYAFQCAFHQPVIDGFMVAYRGNLDDKFNFRNLFVIPWQTKAKNEAAELALAEQLTAPFLLSGESGRYKPRHVAILMDLGASAAFGTVDGPHCQLSYGQATRPVAKRGGSWDGYAKEGEEEPNRYCLNIRGHSPSQYPVIAGFKNQFDQLFQVSLQCSRLEYQEDEERFRQSIDPLSQVVTHDDFIRHLA